MSHGFAIPPFFFIVSFGRTRDRPSVNGVADDIAVNCSSVPSAWIYGVSVDGRNRHSFNRPPSVLLKRRKTFSWQTKNFALFSLTFFLGTVDLIVFSEPCGKASKKLAVKTDWLVSISFVYFRCFNRIILIFQPNPLNSMLEVIQYRDSKLMLPEIPSKVSDYQTSVVLMIVIDTIK